MITRAFNPHNEPLTFFHRASLDLLNNPYILPVRQSYNLPFSQSNSPPIQFRQGTPTISNSSHFSGGCMGIILLNSMLAGWAVLYPLSAHINPIIMQCARNHLIVSNPEGNANDARLYIRLWLYSKLLQLRTVSIDVVMIA